MRKIPTALILALTLLFSGGIPIKDYRLYKEVDDLKKQGITCRLLNDETMEVREEWSGYRKIKTLREPDEAQIRAFAATRVIPTLEIDPTRIDTSKYTGWYDYWTTVPLSNGFGFPLQVGDIDHNGKPEVYGNFVQYNPDFETHIYEVERDGSVIDLYQYLPRRGASMQITDVDKNSLKEIVFQFGDSSFFYEQPAPDSLPTHRKFAYAKYEYPGTGIGTKEVAGNLDNDSLTDFLYRGTLPDTSFNGYQYYTFVAEYNPGMNKFQTVWKTQLERPPGESGLGGYDVGDYDGDGKMDFLASDITGRIWVCENTGDDSYTVTWQDSTPFVNLEYQTSGDVDNDEKREFFVGATMSTGNWTIVYEADSNNHYSPTFLFHLLSGGSLDEPTYLTTDVDGDGKLELVILSGADLYIFKSDKDNSYYLWYYKHNDAKQSIQFYDFDGDGREDFIISKSKSTNPGLIFYADIFRASKVAGVGGEPPHLTPKDFRLFPFYPNPFNPTTNVRFQVPKRSHVVLKVYDVTGREVATVLDETKEPGIFTVSWNAAGLESGVYFCRMQTENYSSTNKVVLLK